MKKKMQILDTGASTRIDGNRLSWIGLGLLFATWYIWSTQGWGNNVLTGFILGGSLFIPRIVWAIKNVQH